MVKRYRELYAETRRALAEMDGDRAGAVARELLGFAAGKTAEEVLRDLDLFADPRVEEELASVRQAYLAGKPLAYILGEWDFFGLRLNVDENVLIPRDDTAVVTALALEYLKDIENPRVLDLCTGSGCIGLAIAKNVPRAHVTLADISEKALRVAKSNITKNHLSTRVSAVVADALAPAPEFLGAYDLIVSNPPYVTRGEMNELQPSVRDYEPHLALLGGEDGLSFYRSISKNYRSAIVEGGLLAFEYGLGQQDVVHDILREYGFDVLLSCRDTSEIIRASIARKV